ncbi:SRPBCC family protein [Microlunatus soli]|uniref:Activator of Hsp90 ATPase homolog 1-like protein n=1 Tax=Microlunatus soli TaxID=630515 RepID=A0A1H1PHN9_9ACTN|nr:SRPBCC family protein [Microlunatus soli]SDS10811.1 Activator of Hsp90 ATPase homolog 1-like protein [Microlunatus soli]
MSSTSTDSTVRQQVTVALPVDRAFALFTEQFDKIKPREHNMLSVPIVESVFEQKEGGSVYDRGEDGSICRWARVLTYEPPTRFVISWDITPRWQIETDPARCSEVEVRFVADGEDNTRVELEHRHLDRHGDGWESERDGIEGPNGWPIYLQRFTDLAGAAE